MFYLTGICPKKKVHEDGTLHPYPQTGYGNLRLALQFNQFAKIFLAQQMPGVGNWHG
jgi:hypothetical protein